MTSHADLLRAIADVLDAHPEMPVPDIDSGTSGKVQFFPHDGPAGVATIMRALSTGRWEKNDPTKSDFTAKHAVFSSTFLGYPVEIITYRSAVCTRRVVGTREVTKTVPLTTEEITVTEEIIEWDCDPVLAQMSA